MVGVKNILYFGEKKRRKITYLCNIRIERRRVLKKNKKWENRISFHFQFYFTCTLFDIIILGRGPFPEVRKKKLLNCCLPDKLDLVLQDQYHLICICWKLNLLTLPFNKTLLYILER